MAGKHPNYHQLLYFWSVIREGGVVKAAESLNVTPQTISGQLKLLQASIKGRLLMRVGRGVEPTDLGRHVFRMAEDMFARGLEISELIRSDTPRGPLPLLVGVADAVPASMVCVALAPALVPAPQPGARLVCREGTFAALLGDLGAHRLDVVLSASALPSSSSLIGSSYLLAECKTAFLAMPSVVRGLKSHFPSNLNGAPWLLPRTGTAIRRALDAWFGSRGIVPRINGEIDDDHLMNALAARGVGIICVPAHSAAELMQQYGLMMLGRSAELLARLYAIVPQSRVQLPALRTILGQRLATPASDADG